MADCDGLQDDPLALGSYSQLLFSDEVDNLSTDGCFNFTSSFSSENPPKTLCFGGYSEECDLGFDDSCTRVAQKTGVALTCNDSSSTKNSNAMDKSLEKSNVSELSAFTVVDTIKKEKKKCLKKRNVSGLGAHDEQVQKNRNSDAGNGNEKAPARTQRNCKKTKSDNSSATGHAKVKKEKLGERILALQQLVSPFGKTDTASVLDEAMGYIRFLHDQVEVLCSPYSQRLPSSAHQQQEDGENGEGEGESRKDLRSKGLCLVPVELTLHVAEDNGADFWSPAMVNSVSSNQRVIFLAMHGLPTAKFVL